MATSDISALTRVLYSNAREVAAEAFGCIDSINRNFDDKGVAVGDEVTVEVAPVQTNSDFVPGATPPEGNAQTAEAVKVKITKARKNSMVLTGEQIRSLENIGVEQDWVADWLKQAMRALRNEAEADGVLALKAGASRAYGTPGTTPFASSLAELTQARKILRDNGAPLADLQLVVNTDAEVNLLNLGIVQQAMQAGGDAERRTGFIGRQLGFRIGVSAGIAQHVKGTGSAYVTSGATAPGVRDITLVTGANPVLAGDIASFAADSANKYVVNKGVTGPGVISLGRPGARVTIPTGNALSIGNSYTPSFAFERNALVGVIRPPIMPANPTIKQQLVSDQTGLTYLFCEISQYGQISWELHLAWGFNAVQSEVITTILG